MARHRCLGEPRGARRTRERCSSALLLPYALVARLGARHAHRCSVASRCPLGGRVHVHRPPLLQKEGCVMAAIGVCRPHEGVSAHVVVTMRVVVPLWVRLRARCSVVLLRILRCVAPFPVTITINTERSDDPKGANMEVGGCARVEGSARSGSPINADAINATAYHACDSCHPGAAAQTGPRGEGENCRFKHTRGAGQAIPPLGGAAQVTEHPSGPAGDAEREGETP